MGSTHFRLVASFVSITTPEEGREAVRSLKVSGSDFIKVQD
jgi:hypothetical protein